ncbi:Zinc finger protein 507 [Merluccius polli]|uniref:Zinc finger protein 507 n=1 Tax=Merluccius polli TaxID=89951 RepID=A0AA47P844_MERPO|nr:Zinc finger protein 507 [Merluccius polli]
MEEISDVAVLIAHSSPASTTTAAATSSSAAAAEPLLTAGAHSRGRQALAAERDACQRLQQQKHAADSLIQVIQKLSKIVEKRPQRRCTLAGQKRAPPQQGSGRAAGGAGGGGGGGGGGSDGTAVSRGTSPCKRVRRSFKEEVETPTIDDAKSPGPPAVSDDDANNNNNNNIITEVADAGGNAGDPGGRTVTCYQCSLCRYLSPTLDQLREHLRQHDMQHSDVILMCSECHYTSPHQGELEAHVRLHFEDDAAAAAAPQTGPAVDDLGECEKEAPEQRANAAAAADVKAEVKSAAYDDDAGEEPTPQKKKWYSFEEYGLYRCLICSYVCSQQRMLKTHAWKHAGLVDCSYPIFEDDAWPPPGAAKREAQAAKAAGPPPAHAHAAAREEVFVLSPEIREKGPPPLGVPGAFQVQLCMPTALENKRDPASQAVDKHNGAPVVAAAAEDDDQELGGVGEYQVKDLNAEEEEEEEEEEEPPIEEEVQVTTEAGNRVVESSRTDSLLSSAQKIISCSPNGEGHINVIVERLPSAEDSVIAANTLLLGPDICGPNKRLSDGEEEEEEEEEEEDDESRPAEAAAMVDTHKVVVKEEVVVSQEGDGCSETTMPSGVAAAAPEVDVKPAPGSEPLRDENISPAGRTRTNSESLRLHSLVAEALVAMPMRTPEPYISGTWGPGAKACLKTAAAQAQSPGAGQCLAEGPPALVDLELRGGAEEEEEEEDDEAAEGGLSPLGLHLGLVEADEEGPAAKAGISLSLLTVIERLRERSDQNATDEDILKELQDNARFHDGAVAAAVVDVASIDRVVSTATEYGGLVDYLPGSERPYRCRRCPYISGNKGYMKQHLRVHRQREPYQCPICEHIALDSKDLEGHMIHHCKARMYQCKQCSSSFHYKSQLRSHEREHHGRPSPVGPALTPLAEAEAMAAAEEVELAMGEESSVPKVYKCDVCDYTSSTYVGVRNHRRIHNSDKPYRCCSCDFATTNMNSLKSHMRRHPQEHQAVQLMEQYRCSLCGYSHMWKHAGDQNYNYEQVNKAIDEAITQSSRGPQKLSATLEPVAERSSVGSPRDQAPRGPIDTALAFTPTTTTTTPSSTMDTSATSQTIHSAVELSQWSSVEVSSATPQPHHAPAPSSSSESPQQTPGPAAPAASGHGPGMEYCVLLFCCCICGFESTSKERLMEHMKEHEGDIISIILNKEQQQQVLQPAEGSAAQ